jgi:TonB family protein
MRKLIIIMLLFAPLLLFSQEEGKDKNPRFKGGESAMRRYMDENLIYPEVSMSNGDSGTIYVRFTIDTDGCVGDVEILRGISPELNNEVIRFINNMPNWIPAKENSEKAAVIVPIHFKLK